MNDILQTMRGISLEEMDSIKLMNRVDTKYLATRAQLRPMLERAAGLYMVLDTGGDRICGYDTLYYDTDCYRMYLDHHNRRLNRQKIRTRRYLSTGGTYLEVKRKNNHGRTKKKRIPIPDVEFLSFACDGAAGDFLEARSDFKSGELSPSTRIVFRRITLVNNAMTERLTVDMDLSFHNFRTGVSAGLGDAVIIELKQDGYCRSDIKEILLDMRVKPLRISKYCIGTVLTEPAVRRSRFIRKIRTVEKVTNNKLLTR
ncbi:MAG: polyphosphate polymerase domain-containing protein [Candidatus Cryptobacteroides sp.]